ncbi:hypothetical protein [Streptomyces hydrogenans]|uniref:hypothetical protein n=1 Tax=Streptomyces hydrogenans TaxID=1873719 RepID=UPI003814DF4F
MQPVLEVAAPDGFALWPVAEAGASGFLALDGGLSPAGAGTAVRAPAACNDLAVEAERLGDTLRLAVDAERPDGPVITLPARALPGLLAGVERDLAVFLVLASGWASAHLPDHDVDPVVAALARALDVPLPTGLPHTM